MLLVFRDPCQTSVEIEIWMWQACSMMGCKQLDHNTMILPTYGIFCRIKFILHIIAWLLNIGPLFMCV